MASIGSFEIEGPLARGGMGTVYRASHPAAGVPVALKVLRGDDPGGADAMHAEITSLAALHHPAIVALYDTGVLTAAEAALVHAAPGTPWVAMELASGGSLADDPPSSWAGMAHHAQAILGALAHAHARGIVHRDLKPGNVLRCLATDLRPGTKLADFGLATRTWERDGRRIGTPRYMAPEQIRGDWAAFGPWTDLYALGCVLHELCCGTTPFQGDSVSDIARAHLRGARSPFAPQFEVPPGLPALLGVLMRPEPERRPDRAADVFAALLALGDIAAPNLPTPPPPAAAAETLDLVHLDPRPLRERPANRPRVPAPPIPPDWRGPPPPRSPVLTNVGMGLSLHRVPPVAGREVEQDRLWAELRRVQPGDARRVHIGGELGAGRSHLARWLGHRAHELGVADLVVVRAPVALGASLVQRLLGLAGLDGQRLRARIRTRLAADPGLAEAVGEALIEGTVGAPLAAAVLRAWTGRRPLILIVDDLSADDIGTVQRLASAAPPAGMLVVTCGEPWPGAHTELHLGPLERPAHRTLVTELLGLSSQVADILEARVGVLPGETLALVRTWVTQGALTPGPRGLELADGRTQSIPADLSEAWAARLLTLVGPGAANRRALLRLAALGTPFEADEIEGVSGGAEAVRQAHRAAVLVADGTQWRFASPVVWEILARWSRQDATWTDDRRWAAGLRAERWPDRPDRWADAALDGEGAGAVGRVLEALDLNIESLAAQAARLRRCLELIGPETPELQIRTLGLLARLETFRGRYAATEAWLEQAAAIDAGHVTVRMARAQLAAYRRRFDEVLELTRVAPSEVPLYDYITLLRQRATAHTERHEPQAALATWRTLFEVHRTQNLQPEADVFRSYARALAQAGRHDEAREQCTRALERVRGTWDWSHQGRIVSELAHLAVLREDWAEALQRADEADAQLAPFGIASQVYAAFTGAIALWSLGRHDELSVRLPRIERLAEALGVPTLGAGAAVLAAGVHARRGEWTAVEADAHRARRILALEEPHRLLAAVAAEAARLAEAGGRADLATSLTEVSEALTAVHEP